MNTHLRSLIAFETAMLDGIKNKLFISFPDQMINLSEMPTQDAIEIIKHYEITDAGHLKLADDKENYIRMDYKDTHHLWMYSKNLKFYLGFKFGELPEKTPEILNYVLTNFK